MTLKYRPLTINAELAANLDEIRASAVRDEAARQAIGRLLQSALELEFATVPTYLSAAFSLTANREIREVILRTAREEMLHMTVVANVMNAIGVPPNVVAAVPTFPYALAILEPPLRLDLKSFSFELVEKLFMQIEAPEEPVEFEVVAGAGRKTIGQFYAGIIDIITNDVIPDLFKDAVQNAYKQRVVDPNFRAIAYLNNQDSNKYPLKPEIDFRIVDRDSAIRHLTWVVDQGEGEAAFDPLTAEGIPGHYYRFESIIKARFLVPDGHVDLKYSYSGADLPFDPSNVHEFDVNAKPGDYSSFPEVVDRMRKFNVEYSRMIDLLQAAFNCPSEDKQSEAAEAYNYAIGMMRRMSRAASAIIAKAKDSAIRAGIPFEYESTITS